MVNDELDGMALAMPSFSSSDGLASGMADGRRLAPWLQQLGHLDPQYQTKPGGGGRPSPQDTIDFLGNEYDKLDPDDGSAQARAASLLGRFHATVDPAAASYSALLAHGVPEYQPGRVSPWLVALGAGLGAAQNALEPQNQTGAQNWVAAPIAQTQQAADDAYARAKQGYASQLDSAQAQYGLAKDRGQTYLEQAQQAEDEARERAARRTQFIAQRIVQDQNATQEEKMESLRYLHESTLRQIESDTQNKRDALARMDNVRQAVVNHLIQTGHIAEATKLLEDMYLEGVQLNPDGTPVDQHYALGLAHLQAAAHKLQPAVVQAAVQRGLAQASAKHGRIYENSRSSRLNSLRRTIGMVAGQLLPISE